MGVDKVIETSTKVLKLGTPPDWVKEEYIQKTDAFWLHDTWYQYAVIDTSKIPKDEVKLPEVFALRTESYLAVSSTYPERYRRPGIIHEVREFSGKEQHEDSCVEALGYELDQLKFFGIYAKDTPEYLSFRLNFFDGLIKFYESEEKPEYEEFLARLRRSRDYLTECIKADPASPGSQPAG